jgi:hypothetical protein
MFWCQISDITRLFPVLTLPSPITLTSPTYHNLKRRAFDLEPELYGATPSIIDHQL